jgi:hypothetical protein
VPLRASRRLQRPLSGFRESGVDCTVARFSGVAAQGV